MDKRVIFAVAGSGKTSYIIDSLTLESRTLIITYAESNLLNLKQRVLAKFGCIPAGVRIYSYYTFLYSFCFRPILGHQMKIKGINWDTPPGFTLKLPRTDPRFYTDRSGRLYHNRIAKLFEVKGVLPEVIERLNKYFDDLCIDEVQDFGGHDFNFICQLYPTNLNMLMVGDFYQHTFDTSRDGNVNGNLHKDYERYQSKFTKAGFTLDLESLSNSYRCAPLVCDFVSEQLGIDVKSHRKDEVEVTLVESKRRGIEIFECGNTVKLFYQASFRYGGFTDNWGAVKGLDCYEDVCVVLNPKTFGLFKKAGLRGLPAQTKNKLYVACTRAKRNLYFVPESIFKDFRN